MADKSTLDTDKARAARVREKAESRQRDRERLEGSEVSVEELQVENSAFPTDWVEIAGIPDFFEKVGR